MLSSQEKAVIITEIHNVIHLPAVQNVLKFLDVLIQEAREENDTADHDNVLRNQGAIAGYKIFADYIKRGLPPAGMGVQ